MASFTRAELESFRDAEVPDLLGPDLRLLFVGINPGLWTAATQTHFAHPANRFYPALLRAGVITAADLAVRRDDRRRPRPPALARHRDHQPGPPRLRPGRRADAPRSCAPAAPSWRRWSRRTSPRVVAVAGITAYRTAFGKPKAVLGRQPEPLAGSELWVVPNPSGLNAHDTVATLAEAYGEVARAAGTGYRAP